MRKIIFLLILLLSEQVFSREFDYDPILAKDISIAYFKSYFRVHPEREPKGLDYSKYEIETATDGNGRKFIFVSFKADNDFSGATMHLEYCIDTLAPSWYGASMNIKKDLQDFKLIKGNKAVDYPGGCYVFE